MSDIGEYPLRLASINGDMVSDDGKIPIHRSFLVYNYNYDYLILQICTILINVKVAANESAFETLGRINQTVDDNIAIRPETTVMTIPTTTKSTTTTPLPTSAVSVTKVMPITALTTPSSLTSVPSFANILTNNNSRGLFADDFQIDIDRVSDITQVAHTRKIVK